MVFVGYFDEFVLAEVAMMIGYCLSASFVDCLGSFVVVGTIDFVSYYNCDFVCSGLLVPVS